jgi:hypothetical protein
VAFSVPPHKYLAVPRLGPRTSLCSLATDIDGEAKQERPVRHAELCSSYGPTNFKAKHFMPSRETKQLATNGNKAVLGNARHSVQSDKSLLCYMLF